MSDYSLPFAYDFKRSISISPGIKDVVTGNIAEVNFPPEDVLTFGETVFFLNRYSSFLSQHEPQRLANDRDGIPLISVILPIDTFLQAISLSSLRVSTWLQYDISTVIINMPKISQISDSHVAEWVYWSEAADVKKVTDTQVDDQRLLDVIHNKVRKLIRNDEDRCPAFSKFFPYLV